MKAMLKRCCDPIPKQERMQMQSRTTSLVSQWRNSGKLQNQSQARMWRPEQTLKPR